MNWTLCIEETDESAVITDNSSLQTSEPWIIEERKRKPNNLLFTQLNINSIQNKFDDLKIFNRDLKSHFGVHGYKKKNARRQIDYFPSHWPWKMLHWHAVQHSKNVKMIGHENIRPSAITDEKWILIEHVWLMVGRLKLTYLLSLVVYLYSLGHLTRLILM